MVKNIAVFGATGFLGLPVTKALVEAGYNVSVLVRDADKAKSMLPAQVNITEGNIAYHHDIKRFLTNIDAIYCNLNVADTEDIDDYHIETDGLREIINASLECGVKRIVYLSSIVLNYQGENDYDWWVFQVKNEAVNYVRDCGIPFTIFYPSSFMENLLNDHKHGKVITLVGESRFPLYYICADDYARMVVNSFKVLGTEDREYNVQGPDCYTMQEAARLFAKHYKGEKLRVKTVSIGWVKFLGLFDKRKRYRVKLMEALNNYNEIFSSEMTWEELGKPTITLTDFASRA
ncbi:MAG: NmrA family NAD(P)-binding protein [Bacteroidota bacterium]